MEKYNATLRYTSEEYKEVEDSTETCSDTDHLNCIAIMMFQLDCLHMPPDFGVKILRHFLRVSGGEDRVKLYLANWLLFYGMLHENGGEGIRLLEELKDPRLADTS